MSYAFDFFEELFPNKNKFLILGNSVNYDYITESQNCILITQGPKAVSLATNLLQNGSVLFHGFDPDQFEIFQQVKHKLKCYYSVVGAEFYHRRLIINLLSRQTLKYVFLNNPRFIIADFLRFLSRKKNKPLYFNGGILTFNEIEFNLFKNKGFINTENKQLHFTYYSGYNFIKNRFYSGENIWLGNSATITNNHLDGLKEILRQDTKKKTYIPVSYGDEGYAQYLIRKHGASPDFVFVKEFLELENYNILLNDCHYFLFLSKRQQSVGNVFMALLNGGTVVLHKSNPTYAFLKKLGVVVFNQKDLRNPMFFSFKLTEEQQILNRERIDYLINKERNQKSVLKGFNEY
jgi:hypothetical protein